MRFDRLRRVRALFIRLLARFLDRQLSARAHVALTHALRPRGDDYRRVFVPGAAAHAARTYAELWSSPRSLAPRAEQVALGVEVAETQDFTAQTRLGRLFPGGYTRVAHLFQPGVVWGCWRYCEPARDLGLAFDGLVFLDDHFAWFPEPWRALPRQPLATQHWAE
jgi:hypothetical protein